MSDEIHFLRAKTLSMKTTRSPSQDEVLRRVMRHNLREVLQEFGGRAGGSVDVCRIHLNERFCGADTAEGVALEASEIMRKAGVSPRKNAALGIEIVFSLPSGLQLDYRAYFIAAMNWAERYFKLPILSAVQHSDESYPHAHIVMLPLRDGRLIGRDILGGRAETVAMHSSFHQEVGQAFGMSQPKPPPRLTAEVRHIAMLQVRDYLREYSGFNDETVDKLVQVLAKDPLKTLAALRLPVPAAPSKSMAGIFTQDCGGKSAIAVYGDSEWGVLDEPKSNRYALIALSETMADLVPNHPTEASPPAPAESAPEASIEPVSVELADAIEEAPEDDQQHAEGVAISGYTRESLDQPSQLWDCDRGEWLPQESIRTPRKRLAELAVQDALLAIGKQTESPNRRLYRH